MDEPTKSQESGRRPTARPTTRDRDATTSTPSTRRQYSADPDLATATGSAERRFEDQGTNRPSETGNGQGGFVGRVRERAGAQLATQKDRATDGIGTIAQAVRKTTQELRQDRHETVAEYVERAADQLERFSAHLKTKDVGELFRDAATFARRRPAIFVGSAFVLGLIGARFLKSSPPTGDRSQPAWQHVGAAGAIGQTTTRPDPATFGGPGSGMERV